MTNPTNAATTYSYSINTIDGDATPEWMRLCATATPGAQDGGRQAWTVTTTQPEALEAALDADADVISYEKGAAAPTYSYSVQTVASPDPDGDGDVVALDGVEEWTTREAATAALTEIALRARRPVTEYVVAEFRR